MSASKPAGRVLAIVLAGGKGERLYPLTQERSKPAVPFGGKYRLIDFVLSNLVNSNIQSIYVLVQYLSQSLIEYIRSNWRTVGLTHDQFITMVPPQMRLGDNWYRGTADAVRQNLNLILDFDPDIVAVFGADHIYRMDIRQMIDAHMQKNADITVAAVPVPISQGGSFGVLRADSRDRLVGFQEKPKSPQPIPGAPGECLASMGNYLFNRDLLVDLLRSAPETEELDFGKSILPNVLKRHRVMAYNFANQTLPGLKEYEEKGYWRDVGSLSAFYEANMDILGAKPRLNLHNRKWFIHSGRYDGPPAKILSARISNCIIGEGCLLRGCTIKNSIIGRGVHIHEGAVITDSIVMDFCKVRAGAKVRRAIVDRFNDVAMHELIGYNLQRDAERYFVDASGLVAIPRGKTRIIK